MQLSIYKTFKTAPAILLSSMIQKAEHMPSLPKSTLWGKHSLSRLDRTEEMRMNLWVSNYKYPENDQKTLPVLLQSRAKMATAEKVLHSRVSCDFIPSLSPHRQIPVTWNLFRRRVNFTLKELGSIIDSTYGTICHCIVSKCFFFELSLHCGQLVSPHTV